jgi:hypothetical protein
VTWGFLTALKKFKSFSRMKQMGMGHFDATSSCVAFLSCSWVRIVLSTTYCANAKECRTCHRDFREQGKGD